VAIPAVIGLALGGAAVAIAFVLLRGDGDGDSSTSAESVPPDVTTVADQETLKIVFPEGFTREEMAERIDAVNEIARDERDLETALDSAEYVEVTKRSKPFQDALPNAFSNDGKVKTLEGFLFPATYDFTASTTVEELVRLQLAAFSEAWGEVNLTRARAKNLTAYDVLVIASMIEEEVRVPKERALVASVIYNRLRDGIPLGIDSTLRYGLRIAATESITQEQLESDSPYNTRKLRGLPPTPITSPGLASIKAAARPKNTKFIFFVRTKDCRTHFFAETEEEFLAFLTGPRSFLNGPDECG
jgi:uncharacterized YceG family protein